MGKDALLVPPKSRSIVQVNPQRMANEMRIQRPLHLATSDVKPQVLQLHLHQIAAPSMKVVQTHPLHRCTQLDALLLDPQDRLVQVPLRRRERPADGERSSNVGRITSPFAACVEENQVAGMEREEVLGVVDREGRSARGADRDVGEARGTGEGGEVLKVGDERGFG